VEDRLKVGVITDIHVAPADSAPDAWHNPYDFDGTEGRLASALELFGEEGVGAVFVLGDLAHFGDDASLARVERVLAASPAPTWIAPGNHDLIVGLPAFATKQPRDARIAILTPTKEHGHWSAAAELELGDEPALVLSHFPLVSRREALSAAGLKYAGDLVDQPDLLAALQQRPTPTIVFSGHLHVRDSVAEGPVLQLLFPATIEYPFECAIVELDGGEVRRRAIRLHDAPAESDPVLSAERERWVYSAATASSSATWTERET
jgi:hypothetical protein